MKIVSRARIVLLAMLSFLVCNDADAQFFKKLGKALEKASGYISTPSEESSSTSSEQGGARIVNPIKTLKIEYKGVTVEYGQQCINFVLTNIGTSKLEINKFEKLDAYSSDGNRYDSRSVIGNVMTSLGNGDFTFEPGVPVRAKIIIIDCPLSVKTMSLVKINTTVYSKTKGYEDKFIEFRNVSLTPVTVIPENALTGKTYCKKPADANYRLGGIELKRLDGDYVYMRLSYSFAKKSGQVDRTFIGKWVKNSERIVMYETTGMNLNRNAQEIMTEATDGPDISEWYLDFDISTGYFSFMGDTFNDVRGY